MTPKIIRYTQQDCYIRAVELDLNRADIWNNLRTGMPDGQTVAISGTQYNNVECLVRSLASVSRSRGRYVGFSQLASVIGWWRRGR